MMTFRVLCLRDRGNRLRIFERGQIARVFAQECRSDNPPHHLRVARFRKRRHENNARRRKRLAHILCDKCLEFNFYLERGRRVRNERRARRRR